MCTAPLPENDILLKRGFIAHYDHNILEILYGRDYLSEVHYSRYFDASNANSSLDCDTRRSNSLIYRSGMISINCLHLFSDQFRTYLQLPIAL